MKIKEVQAGVKLTKNYDSYQISLTADLEINENPEKVGEELMEKALEIVSKKVKSNKNSNTPSGIEVGAAWLHKKSKDLLSVKMSENGNWEHVKISDLEKVGEEYHRKTSEGTLIFRKIPKEKRRNNKMPIYRIYKIGKGITNE